MSLKIQLSSKSICWGRGSTIKKVIKSNRHNFPCKNHCLYHVQKHLHQNSVLIRWKPKRCGLATLQTVYEKDGHYTRMDILTIFDNLSHWLFSNVKKSLQNWYKIVTKLVLSSLSPNNKLMQWQKRRFSSFLIKMYYFIIIFYFLF